MSSHSIPEAHAKPVPDLPSATARVIEAAEKADLPIEVRQMTLQHYTLAQAAEHFGCSPDAIARTVLYKGKTSRKPVLLIVSGEHRIDERTLAVLVGEVLEKADADFVLRATGYAMGGIAPFGILNRITVLMDNRLTQFQQIWCSAGTPDRFFTAHTRGLARAAAARIVQIT